MMRYVNQCRSVFYGLQTGQEKARPFRHSDFSRHLGYFCEMDDDKNPHNVSITSSSAAIDAIVLGTVNAPYKRSISAEELANALASGETAAWLVHVATFFTDVRPALIIDFAAAHKVAHSELKVAYAAVKQASGEQNLSLEATLVALAETA